MPIRADTDDLIAFLNSLVALDPYAIAELLCTHVPCNNDLAEHPTVQVRDHRRATYIPPGTYRVGFLGILNGYCGVIDHGARAGWGPIAAVYEDGRLVGFDRIPEAGAGGAPKSPPSREEEHGDG